MYEKDRRIVITLDAGGTNFVFGAVQGDRFVVEPITLPSNSDRLDRCLETMVEGFRTVIGRLPEQPAAISFAFPGPADYPRGIIGGYLPNFPSFRDGVALKDFLEERFGIPTFINNDGDLYAYGEALAGALPEINARLEAAGSAKRFRNLIGYTWGTGFGVGIVSDNRLHIGDNSCVETFCLRHKDLPDINVEEGVSIRAVKRLYAEYAGVDDDTLDPKAIFEIAEGERPGDADTIAVDDRDVVVVNYEGKNRKGKVFDSSYERNEPAEFPLNRVIKGWTEGMKLVGKGGKITLWIPAELAYGERGAGRDIGANEALEFSVEVVDVKPYVEPAPADSTKVAEPAKK